MRRLWQALRRRWLARRRQRLGFWGQARAERYLRRRGYRIAARNWRAAGGELDLVAISPDGAVVFVEVKTRRSEAFAPTVAVVNRRKQRHMAAAARQFLRRFRLTDRPARFDVITALASPREKTQIQHYPSAFVP